MKINSITVPTTMIQNINTYIIKFSLIIILFLYTSSQAKADDVVRFTPQLKKAALKYSRILPFHNGVAPAKRKGKWGLINTNGEEFLACKYDKVPYQENSDFEEEWLPFHEGLAAVRIGDDEHGKWGFINNNGKEVIPCKYDECRDFIDGMAAVRIGDWKTGKWGFINNNGVQIIPCKYDYVVSFKDGLAAVRIGDDEHGKWGLINNNGEQIIPCKYDNICSFENGLAAVRIGDDKHGKWGFINTKGEQVIPCKYDDIDRFIDGMAKVRIGDRETGKWGFINTKGEQVTPCKYDDIFDFHQGLAVVIINDKWGLINTNGEEIVACKYDNVPDQNRAFTGDWWPFQEGLAAFRIGGQEHGKYGFINTKGEEVIPCKYDYVEVFHEGLALVGIGNYEKGKKLFINYKGEEVIICNYDCVFDFNEGLALVVKDNKYGFINTKGEEVIPCNSKYDEVGYAFALDAFTSFENLSFCNGLIAVMKNDKYGFINKQGFEVFPCIYDGPAKFKDGYAEVCRDGKRALINLYGEELICGQRDVYMPLIYGTWEKQFGDGATLTLIIQKNKITEIVKRNGRLISKETKNYTINYEYKNFGFLIPNAESIFCDYYNYIKTENSKYVIAYERIYSWEYSEFIRVKTSSSGEAKRKVKRRR